jgi:Arabinose-binding domain of AraC transcription regulator, N-term
MLSPSTTVPIDFVRQLLDRSGLAEHTRLACLAHTGISPDLLDAEQARATTEQFVALYRLFVARAGDESPGMFSRPLRPGTLKFLALSTVQAPTLLIAMHRFTQFFRLLIDDLHFDLAPDSDCISVMLRPQTTAVRSQRFTQEVMLKLVHGIASWLAGTKIPLRGATSRFQNPRTRPITSTCTLVPPNSTKKKPPCISTATGWKVRCVKTLARYDHFCRALRQIGCSRPSPSAWSATRSGIFLRSSSIGIHDLRMLPLHC